MIQGQLSRENFITEYYVALKNGETTKDLAKRLGVTPNVIYVHMASFKRKTGQALPPLKTLPKIKKNPTPPTRKAAPQKRSYVRSARPEMAAEDYVRGWQQAENMQKFCEEFGLDPSSCRRRTNKLRKLGVPLKKFPGSEKLDIAGLIALAESLAPKEAVPS